MFSSMITMLDILPYVSQNETSMYFCVHFDCFLPGFKTETLIETKPKLKHCTIFTCDLRINVKYFHCDVMDFVVSTI